MKKRFVALSAFLAALCFLPAFGACGPARDQSKAPLTFLAVNDLHGRFMDTENQPGVDEFTTYLKQLYQNSAREEILLSSGDMWQGTVESSSNKGALMTEWMNEAGFVSMTLGNHEFDWGTAAIAANAELADFSILGINVNYNGAPAAFCKPSVVVEKGGVKVGVIGAIGDCLSSISGEFQPGLEFATGDALTELVKTEATRLRTEDGCDFIVYSLHDGGDGFSASGVTKVEDLDLPYYDTSLSDGYIDLVFEGHSHQRYILQDEYGVYHLQAGGENGYLGSVEVTFAKDGEPVVEPKLLSKEVFAKNSLRDDPIVGELYGKYFSESDPYGDVLGDNFATWTSYDIADKVAELYYKKGVETWGETYEIALGGGYLKLRKPYDLARGDVTYADLFSLLPFDNAVVLGKISGKYLKRNFLSNKDNYHTYGAERTNASEIDDDGTYYIVVDTYTSTYAPNHITEVARLDGGVYARDLVAEYIKAGYRAS